MRMLTEFFYEFNEMLGRMDGANAQEGFIDEKTYHFICFALSIKTQSGQYMLKHFKQALEAGATVQELAYILALVSRMTDGKDACSTHDVLRE